MTAEEYLRKIQQDSFGGQSIADAKAKYGTSWDLGPDEGLITLRDEITRYFPESSRGLLNSVPIGLVYNIVDPGAYTLRLPGGEYLVCVDLCLRQLLYTVNSTLYSVMLEQLPPMSGRTRSKPSKGLVGRSISERLYCCSRVCSHLPRSRLREPPVDDPSYQRTIFFHGRFHPGECHGFHVSFRVRLPPALPGRPSRPRPRRVQWDSSARFRRDPHRYGLTEWAEWQTCTPDTRSLNWLPPDACRLRQSGRPRGTSHSRRAFPKTRSCRGPADGLPAYIPCPSAYALSPTTATSTSW